MIRLSEQDVKHISETFRSCFLEGDQLWLFGSRANPKAKGGDIDLYIETQLRDSKQVIEAKIEFISQLMFKIGEQKVDVVVKFSPTELPIYQVAREEGIRLV